MNQKEIIQRCKQNDYTAQLVVYTNYKDMLYNSCVRLLKNREDAEDVVHDAFIKGFQKVNQLSDEMHIGAWFRRIAINLSLDKIRKEKKNVWIDNSKELVAEVTEIEFEEAEAYSVANIKKSMLELKEKYSIILTLYLIEDYTHKEIAFMLGLNESTVRNQYRRGKKQLKERLEKQQEDEFKRVHTAS